MFELFIFELDFPGKPPETLLKDVELFESEVLFIRVFRFPKRCASVGKNCSQELERFLKEEGGKRFQDFEVIRRPTGGGVLLHSKKEFCFSLTFQKVPVPKFFSILSGAIANVIFEFFSGLQKVRKEDFRTLENGDVIFQDVKISGFGAKVGKKLILAEGVVKVGKILDVLNLGDVSDSSRFQTNLQTNIPKFGKMDNPCFPIFWEEISEKDEFREDLLKELAKRFIFGVPSFLMNGFET